MKEISATKGTATMRIVECNADQSLVEGGVYMELPKYSFRNGRPTKRFVAALNALGEINERNRMARSKNGAKFL
ncbi:hypothetical protein JNL27_14590 [bacterium]|nr:hypothetical protein [bacterium]